jgi:hypothetical protein
LEELAKRLTQHLVLPKHSETAIPLWCILSHVHNAACHSPILGIQSPAPRCGKTTLMRLIGMVVPSPLAASNVRPAAIYRSIAKWAPTLLLDEADTFVRENEELRGILNSGHQKDMAYVIRTVGDNHDPMPFSTWCPKVIAMIGFLPTTLQDRSVVISMRRKRAAEIVQPLPNGNDAGLTDLRSMFARWAADNVGSLATATPGIPPELNDRAADNWRTLLAIADHVGGVWPQRAREAAIQLSGRSNDDDVASLEVQLLADIRRAFRDSEAGWFASSKLVEKLCAIEDAPWSELNRGRCLSGRGLAVMLKPFGIRSRHTNSGSQYDASMFEEAWASYLPSV